MSILKGFTSLTVVLFLIFAAAVITSFQPIHLTKQQPPQQAKQQKTTTIPINQMNNNNENNNNANDLKSIILNKILKNNKNGDDNYTPLYPHLSFTENPTEMVIQFHINQYDKNYLGNPIIKFSEIDNTLQNNYQNATIGNIITTYGESEYTGYDISIKLINLKCDKNTIYYYQITYQNKFNIIKSNIYSFITKECNSLQNKLYKNLKNNKQLTKTTFNKTNIIMFGDMGIFGYFDTVKSIENYLNKNKNPTFIYHVGDISYADAFPHQLGLFQIALNKYFDSLSNIMPYIPYMVLPGNHEYGPKAFNSSSNYEINFASYNHRYFMPLRNNSLYQHNMWYSFEYGPITFISISTETSFENNFFPFSVFNGNQLDWLEKTLQKVNRKVTPWVIVTGHRPIYTSMHGYSTQDGQPNGECKIIQNVFENLLFKYNVDIYMSGHIHTYERSFPVYQSQIEKDSNLNKNLFHNVRFPIHIVNGAAGMPEGVVKCNNFYTDHIWTAGRYCSNIGYGILSTDYDLNKNEHVLQFNFYDSTTEAVVDSFTITKD
ncbi:hypothetical protein ABK040_004561 [Willaertia magna]